MIKRLRIIGVVVAIIGVVGLGASAYAYMRVQDGTAALQGFSDSQNVTLSYNDDGELVDRGTTEGAAAILGILEDSWRWPVNRGDLNPKDPVVNTSTEYMYQMATIAQHTLHGNQNVTLTDRVEYDANGDGIIASDAPVYSPLTLPDGVWSPKENGYVDAIFEPGTYVVPVEGRYWTGFNRTHPLDGPARSQAWDGTVHGLFAELGVGATTYSSLEMGLGVAAVTALMGVGFLVFGAGLVWATYAKKAEEEVTERTPSAAAHAPSHS